MSELPLTVQEVAEKAAGGDVEAFLVGMVAALFGEDESE